MIQDSRDATCGTKQGSGYEEARAALDSIYLDYIPTAASWFSALEDLRDEHPEMLEAVVTVIRCWQERDA